MVPIKVGNGKFKMLVPTRSILGNYIIVGAIVANVGLYTKRLSPTASRDDLRRALGQIREQIHKDHPGIKEEFTRYRPAHHYN